VIFKPGVPSNLRGGATADGTRSTATGGATAAAGTMRRQCNLRKKS